MEERLRNVQQDLPDHRDRFRNRKPDLPRVILGLFSDNVGGGVIDFQSVTQGSFAALLVLGTGFLLDMPGPRRPTRKNSTAGRAGGKRPARRLGARANLVAVRFDQVLGTFLRHFQQERIRHALIGGLAMQALGHSRFTRDVDLAVEGSARDRVIAFAKSLGYETLHASEGYSNHLHADPDWGRVDFMYLDPATAESVFAEATAKPVLGDLSAPVPKPEHLLAMKAISMKNSPHRVLIDSPDVQFLLGLPGVNRNEVRDYFARHGLLELFDAIEKRS